VLALAIVVAAAVAGSGAARAGPIAALPGPPAVTASASPTGGPIPFNVTLSANGSSGVPPYTFVWSFGDGTPDASGAALTHVYRFWGVFEANVTLTDSLGDTASGSVNVTVTPQPLVLTAYPSTTTVAVGGAVTLVTSVTGGARPFTYAWTGLPPGCPTIGAENLSCQVTSAGVFNVSVTVTDSLGATDRAGFQLTVTGGGSTPPTQASEGGPSLALIVGLAVGAALIGALGGLLWTRRRSRR